LGGNLSVTAPALCFAPLRYAPLRSARLGFAGLSLATLRTVVTAHGGYLFNLVALWTVTSFPITVPALCSAALRFAMLGYAPLG